MVKYQIINNNQEGGRVPNIINVVKTGELRRDINIDGPLYFNVEKLPIMSADGIYYKYNFDYTGKNSRYIIDSNLNLNLETEIEIDIRKINSDSIIDEDIYNKFITVNGIKIPLLTMRIIDTTITDFGYIKKFFELKNIMIVGAREEVKIIKQEKDVMDLINGMFNISNQPANLDNLIGLNMKLENPIDKFIFVNKFYQLLDILTYTPDIPEEITGEYLAQINFVNIKRYEQIKNNLECEVRDRTKGLVEPKLGKARKELEKTFKIENKILNLKKNIEKLLNDNNFDDIKTKYCGINNLPLFYNELGENRKYLELLLNIDYIVKMIDTNFKFTDDITGDNANKINYINLLDLYSLHRDFYSNLNQTDINQEQVINSFSTKIQNKNDQVQNIEIIKRNLIFELVNLKNTFNKIKKCSSIYKFGDVGLEFVLLMGYFKTRLSSNQILARGGLLNSIPVNVKKNIDLLLELGEAQDIPADLIETKKYICPINALTIPTINSGTPQSIVPMLESNKLIEGYEGFIRKINELNEGLDTYPCCVENSIFQMVKTIFWDYAENKYDIESLDLSHNNILYHFIKFFVEFRREVEDIKTISIFCDLLSNLKVIVYKKPSEEGVTKYYEVRSDPYSNIIKLFRYLLENNINEPIVMSSNTVEEDIKWINSKLAIKNIRIILTEYGNRFIDLLYIKGRNRVPLLKQTIQSGHSFTTPSSNDLIINIDMINENYKRIIKYLNKDMNKRIDVFNDIEIGKNSLMDYPDYYYWTNFIYTKPTISNIKKDNVPKYINQIYNILETKNDKGINYKNSILIYVLTYFILYGVKESELEKSVIKLIDFIVKFEYKNSCWNDTSLLGIFINSYFYRIPYQLKETIVNKLVYKGTISETINNIIFKTNIKTDFCDFIEKFTLDDKEILCHFKELEQLSQIFINTDVNILFDKQEYYNNLCKQKQGENISEFKLPVSTFIVYQSKHLTDNSTKNTSKLQKIMEKYISFLKLLAPDLDILNNTINNPLMVYISYLNRKTLENLERNFNYYILPIQTYLQTEINYKSTYYIKHRDIKNYVSPIYYLSIFYVNNKIFNLCIENRILYELGNKNNQSIFNCYNTEGTTLLLNYISNLKNGNIDCDILKLLYNKELLYIKIDGYVNTIIYGYIKNYHFFPYDINLIKLLNKSYNGKLPIDISDLNPLGEYFKIISKMVSCYDDINREKFYNIIKYLVTKSSVKYFTDLDYDLSRLKKSSTTFPIMNLIILYIIESVLNFDNRLIDDYVIELFECFDYQEADLKCDEYFKELLMDSISLLFMFIPFYSDFNYLKLIKILVKKPMFDVGFNFTIEKFKNLVEIYINDRLVGFGFDFIDDNKMNKYATIYQTKNEIDLLIYVYNEKFVDWNDNLTNANLLQLYLILHFGINNEVKSYRFKQTYYPHQEVEIDPETIYYLNQYDALDYNYTDTDSYFANPLFSYLTIAQSTDKNIYNLDIIKSLISPKTFNHNVYNFETKNEDTIYQFAKDVLEIKNKRVLELLKTYPEDLEILNRECDEYV